MTRSKKIFAAFAFVFAVILAYVVYDISSRTTFPGTRQGKEQPSPHTPGDSAKTDSLGHRPGSDRGGD